MTDGGPDVAYADRARDVLGVSRWWQVVAAVGMMAAVSPYQYVWSSIAPPLSESLDIAPAALGAVFSVFVVFQSLSQFPAGWWRDRRGPRVLVFVAALLAGGGYVGLAYATSVLQLYVLYSLGAVGVGIVYTVAVNTAVKWFPDRTGVTTGLGTMAFAAGSVLAVPYVRANATVDGYAGVLRTVGLVILVVLLAGAFILRDPPDEWLGGDGRNGPEDPRRLEDREERAPDSAAVDAPADHAGDDEDHGDADGTENGGDGVEESPAGGTVDADDGVEEGDEDGPGDLAASIRGPAYTTREMLGTWQFWLLYAMFVVIAGADLVVIANVVTFADELGFTDGVATIAATLLPLAAGGSRLVLGDLTDRIGRKPVMVVSFLLAGLFRVGLVAAGRADRPSLFVALVLLSMFFSSPLYVFFPSLLSDYYGSAFSSSNYAVLYTAKVGGGVVAGTLAGYLAVTYGWGPTFLLGGGFAAAAGLGALLLRPPSDAGIGSAPVDDPRSG